MNESRQEQNNVVSDLKDFYNDLDWAVRNKKLETIDFQKLKNLIRDVENLELLEETCKNCQKWEKFEDLQFTDQDDMKFEQNVDVEHDCTAVF